jgi:ABC-type multidrug transport system fused ATPase/permease subunit
MVKKPKIKLSPPKLTFSGFKQMLFVLSEVFKIAYRIKPGMLITILVINAVFGFTSVFSVYLLKLIIDRLVEAIGTTDLEPVLYSVAILFFIGALISLARQTIGRLSNFLSRQMARYFDIEMDLLIGKKMSELDIKTIEDPDFKDRFNKIERESSRRAWQLMVPLSAIPESVFGFISAVVVIAAVSPWLSLIMIIFSVPRILVNQSFIKKFYELDSSLSTDNRIWGWLRRLLVINRNFMELKILNISDHLVKKMGDTANSVVDKMVNLRIKQEKSRTLSTLPLSILEFITAMVLAYWVLIQRITIGSFQLFINSFRISVDSLSNVVGNILEIYENYIYVTDLIWFLNLKPQIDHTIGEVDVLDKSNITFSDIWFRYRDDNPWVLKGIDFKIQHGEKIALVGENGAGKTTLIKLLGRFYDPNKGEILLGEKNLKDFNVKSWWRKLAILFQQFELYGFSAHESIGYGDISRINDLTSIKQAAKKAGIHDYIENLVKGYETPLIPEIEFGVHPSSGQIQRIGVARMLFRKNAQIIILDEPTSNVDPEGEEEIFEELKKITRDKILIFVTQRFSTVRIADRIFVMHKGKITEQGTHDELMKKNGKYAKLFNLQAQAYKVV